MIKTDTNYLSLICPEGSWGSLRRPCPGTSACTCPLLLAGDTDCLCSLLAPCLAPRHPGLAGGGWGQRPARLVRGRVRLTVRTSTHHNINESRAFDT